MTHIKNVELPNYSCILYSEDSEWTLDQNFSDSSFSKASWNILGV